MREIRGWKEMARDGITKKQGRNEGSQEGREKGKKEE